MKDMIEHFPSSKGGGKSDPQLIWGFGENDIQLKSWETGVDSKNGRILTSNAGSEL